MNNGGEVIETMEKVYLFNNFTFINTSFNYSGKSPIFKHSDIIQKSAGGEQGLNPRPGTRDKF